MTPTSFSKKSLLIYLCLSASAMAPMNISFMLVLAAWIWNRKSPAPVRFREFESSDLFRTYRFWALTLLITCWGSLLVTAVFPYEYAGHAPEVTFHGFTKIWYLCVPAILLAVYELATKNDSEKALVDYLGPWWLMTIFYLVIAVIQFFTGWPLEQEIPTNPGRYHAILFLGHHLSTSSVFIFPAFTALAVAFGKFTGKKTSPSIQEDGWFSSKMVWMVGIAGVLILFLSYARTGWLAILLGMAILFQKYFGRHLTRKQWVASVVGMLLFLSVFSQTPLVKERIQRMMGVNERFLLWKANFDFFVHRPLTGIGWLKTQEMSKYYFKSIDPENYEHYFMGHAHSNFFEMLGGTGLIGLFAFLGWSWFTLRQSHLLSKRFAEDGKTELSDFTFGIMVALILLHFNGLTNVTFWEGKVMHQQMIAIGFLLILDRLYLKSKNRI